MTNTNTNQTNTNQQERTKANEKILNRVRKLLAMSKDTSSPHEAAIAAKRARSLIDQYQISELDLADVKSTDFIETPLETFKQYNTNLGIMSVAIAQLNDCQAKRLDKPSGCHYVFQGLLVDSVSAYEMITWLRFELFNQVSEIKGKRNKNAYEAGFARGIAQNVREILKERSNLKMESSGQSLMVVKSKLVESHFGVAKYSKARVNNGYKSEDAYSAGYTSGKNTNLSRQIADNYQAKISI